ncbi:Crp/Fnr family transcriptional regulator [Bergeyella sp. RCAD1439]|uniref:Crp/Fnr family transcriptional regulator n=1 Tax=Bergeyella anatis TaxID=3113737 RepID=UPI002E17DCF9|nr:Crp/Fnr family transcriptional regulator [Bergeyella sp. RCAD1439]
MEAQPILSACLLEDLRALSVVKHYRGGEMILDENAAIRSVPIVAKGAIRVLRTEEDGREILLYYIKAGESCVMSLLGGMSGQASKVRAEVEEEAEVLFVPVDRILARMKESPELLDYVFRLYQKRFEELLDMVNEVTFRKVDERLWSLLEKKSALGGGKVLQVTHEQLAGELGTARVVVSRVLKTFEEEGKLKLGRGKIELV